LVDDNLDLGDRTCTSAPSSHVTMPGVPIENEVTGTGRFKSLLSRSEKVDPREELLT
jgi:hypothetical protein